MRENKWRVRCLFVSLLTLFFGLYSSQTAPVFAQDTPDQGFNLITSPLPISLSGEPGTTLSADIRVKNGGTKMERLKVGLMKFSAYGEEGKPAIDEREPGDDYFDWVTFSPSVFDAPPNEWKTVKVTIKLPQTAAFGYYYAAVFSRAGNPQSSGKQNVLVGSTAVLVLVEAKVPGAKRAVEVTSFQADKRFYEFLPASFSVKLRNTGNVHLVPAGNIFISRGKKEVASLKVNVQQGNLLPNSNRIYGAAWDDGFPVYTEQVVGGKTVLDKQGKPVKSLHWDLTKVSKLKAGRYTAHLVMAYDDGTRDVPLEAYVSFWVIPWRVFLLAIAIPAVPAILVYLLMRWRFKKRLQGIKRS
jgi:hypothetical protein